MRALTLIAALAAICALALGAGSGSASVSCWRTVVNDWYRDGTIDKEYAPQCYRDALSHVTDQDRIYSDLPQQLDRGLASALRGHKKGGVKSARHSSRTGGPIQKVLGELGPDRADAVPMPLMILGGLALILIAAGGTSAVLRRVRRTRG